MYQLPENKALVLRSNTPDLKSWGGFQWPESGEVACPDWKKTESCGNGLHGWLWATGDYGLKVNHPQAKWLVVEVDKDKTINLDGKVKFPSGNVILCGTFRQAYDLVMKWFWLTEAKANTTSATGKYGHASATGDSGHASATGYSGHASATGDSGHASATGKYGHASATGKYGHASATGDSGHASATGDSGHASATGDSGHASATGKYGHACVLSSGGKAMCGENGAIILTYWDSNRYRHVVGYAGENGIESGVLYRLNDKQEFVKVID